MSPKLTVVVVSVYRSCCRTLQFSHRSQFYMPSFRKHKLNIYISYWSAQQRKPKFQCKISCKILRQYVNIIKFTSNVNLSISTFENGYPLLFHQMGFYTFILKLSHITYNYLPLFVLLFNLVGFLFVCFCVVGFSDTGHGMVAGKAASCSRV